MVNKKYRFRSLSKQTFFILITVIMVIQSMSFSYPQVYGADENTAVIEYPPLEWSKTVYQAANTFYSCRVLQTDDDGDGKADDGYITGSEYYNSSTSRYDTYFVKASSDGTRQWTLRIDATKWVVNTLPCQGKDGCFYAVGSPAQLRNGDPLKFCIIKIDQNGSVLWEKIYFTPEGYPNYSRGDAICSTDDGGIVAIGQVIKNFKSNDSLSTYGVVKINPEGDVIWQKEFGDPRLYCKAETIKETKDGGFIIGGTKTYVDQGSPGQIQQVLPVFSLMKLNSLGGLSWEKTFNYLLPNSQDMGYQAVEASDGGYYLCGETDTKDSIGNIACVVKTDKYGNHLWHNFIMGDKGSAASSVAPTADGGCITAGYIYTDSDTYCSYMSKLDANGTKLWEKLIDYAEVRWIAPTSDKGMVLCGNKNKALFLEKYGADTDSSSISLNANCNQDLTKLDIVARAISSETGLLTPDNTKTATYELLDSDQKSLGVHGSLQFDPDSSSWKIEDISPLTDGSFTDHVRVSFIDKEGHKITEISAVEIINLYTSSSKPLDGSGLMIYATVKEFDQYLVTSGSENMKIIIKETGEEIELSDSEAVNDLAPNDGVYASWYTVKDKEAKTLVLYKDGCEVYSKTITPVDQADLVVLTDYLSLYKT
ncbi:MAG: hypothetical protein GX660_03405, partial [Clostridiaceae bacterium]|nr:hypothetical protein [Clostridiaceae bacterium]